MKLLYIDSDETFAGDLKRSLERGGVDVELHADGRAGVDAARAAPPDAIVLAVELGDRLTGGYTWCQKLKKDDQLRDIPLILVSSQATRETFEQHKKLKNRAEEYLRKPFDAALLLDAVGRHVALPPGAVDAAGATVHGAPIPLPEELFAADEELLELDEAFDLLTSPDRGSPPPAEEGFDIALAEELDPDAVLDAPPEVLPSPWAAATELGAEELRAQLAALESRLAAAERELAEKSAEVEASRTLGNRDRDYFQLRTEGARKEKEILRLREDLNRAELEGLELREAQTGLEQRLAQLEAELAQKDALARNALARAEAASISQRRTEGSVSALRAERKELNAALEAARGEAEELRSRLAGRDEEAAAEREQLGASAAEVQRLGTELEASRDRAAQLEAELAAARGELTALESELAGARAETTRLETGLADARAEATRLGAELEKARAAALRFEADLKVSLDEAARLETERNEALDEGARAGADLATARETLGKLEEAHGQATAEVARLGEQLAERDGRIARIEEELAGARRDLEVRGEATERARNALAEALAALGR